MSSVIKLNEGNCRNCYKCIRECQLKAITCENGHVEIIEDECVLCGRCIDCCPQNARQVKNHVQNVRQLLAGAKPVYVTIAPSWVSWFGTRDFGRVSAAIKKLGFAHVEETAIGAREVSREYARLVEEGQLKHIITTACPSVVMLVERHFPSLVKMLAPVSSPMMAHARLMRELYGDIKVVFIGPCLSKIQESEDPMAGGLVNCVLTFEELSRWMQEEGVTLESAGEDEEARGMADAVPRLYPKPGGILATIDQSKFVLYTPMAVDGLEECYNFFQELAEHPDMDSMFIEANVCPGSCAGGPILRARDKNLVGNLLKITAKPMAHDKTPAPTDSAHFPHPRVFASHKSHYPIPTEEEIRAILASIGKTTPEQELNCGSCGYPTCRDKAIAVFQGKADVTMCLPYLRDRAESLSNIVIEHSPNGIIAFDSDLCVQEINPTAQRMFTVSRADALGLPMPEFYGDPIFDTAQETGKPASKKVTVAGAGGNLDADVVVTYVPEHKMYLMILKDVSAEEENKRKLEEMRQSTMNVAQNVIEKQMRVAQEIASLLGETTAETKVALTKLKKSFDSDSQ